MRHDPLTYIVVEHATLADCPIELIEFVIRMTGGVS